jgi:hypothetical protein
MACKHVMILLAGVAASSLGGAAMAGSKHEVKPTVMPDFNQPDLSAKNNGYMLTPEDLKLDCKKLTGKIQVGILQLRSEQSLPKTSELARGLQQAATPFVAGTNRGINPEGDQARALTQLKAYNGRLAAKNCAVYDLEAELKPGATNTPRPIPKPKPARGVPGAAAPATAKAP